jgi:hypothetical protein
MGGLQGWSGKSHPTKIRFPDHPVGLTTLPLSCADCLEIWEPQPPGTLRGCPGLYRGALPFTCIKFQGSGSHINKGCAITYTVSSISNLTLNTLLYPYCTAQTFIVAIYSVQLQKYL